MKLPLPSNPIDIPTLQGCISDELIEPNSPPGKNRKAHEQAQTMLEVLTIDRVELEMSRKPLFLGDTESIPRLFSDDADTLVYIDPPQPSFDMDCPVMSLPHRVHSRNLLSTRSSYFERLFNPNYQSRIIKRRDLDGRLPENIKYVIDLTPPIVEDEAVITIMELSCPLGVRSWATKRSRWDLPVQCVGGIDEYEPADLQLLLSQGKTPDKLEDRQSTAEKEKPDKCRSRDKFEANEKAKCNSKSEDKEKENEEPRPTSEPKPKPILPIEYSASRHRRMIEQILHVLEGNEVALDTPCKVWTFFSLANLFEVASTPRICDRILAWFYESTNTRFIELNPEVSYRVACGIKCSSLCRFAFSILVGEETMLLLAKTTTPADFARPTNTVHGRARDIIDDTEIQRIEYASKSFMDYVIGRFAYLVGTEMPWLAELAEYQKIINYTVKSVLGREAVDELISALKNYVRTCCYSQLSLNLPTWTLNRLPTAADDNDYPTNGFSESYSAMRYSERITSRTFWGSLMRGDWLARRNEPPGAPLTADLRKLPAFKDIDTWFTHVSKEELTSKVQRFNNYVKLDLIPSPPGPSQHDAFPWEPSGPVSSDNAETETHLVDLSTLYSQIYAFTTKYARQMAQPPQTIEVLFPELTDVLTCLTEDEYSFLPLWAGGNDDGTGGAFTDQDIPIIEGNGFSPPGRITAGNTLSETSYTMPSQGTFESTVQRVSHRATESHHTEVWSMSSMASALRSDAEIAEGNYGTIPVDWQMEDDAPISISGASSESQFDEDEDDGNTIGERESISDFLSDDDGLELDLENGGLGDADGNDDFDDYIGEGTAHASTDNTW